MLKIHKLEEERRLYLIELSEDLPEKVKYKSWGKGKGLTKKEWNAFQGYLKSNEYLYDGKNRRVRRKARIAKKQKVKRDNQKVLKSMHYSSEYLKSEHWQKLRKRVKRRDKRCKLCNSSVKMQVHHRSYKNMGDSEKEIKDLVLLCGDCHSLFHTHSKLHNKK